MSDSGIDLNSARSSGFRSCAATHAGPARTLNEDAFVNRPDLGLWAGADGAGGHQAGDVASTEVATLLQAVEPGLSAGEMLVMVRARLEEAHVRLRDVAARRGGGAIVA